MRHSPSESIAIASVLNLRDLGGWPTRDGGHVCRGLLFRSAALDKLQGDDMSAFAGLGIRCVFDMRTEQERSAQPDRVPEGTDQIVVDVLADSRSDARAQLLNVLAHPKEAAQVLGGGKAVALVEHSYSQLVSLPSALTAYRQFFSDLAEAEHRPALFHCSIGKDRTGWAAAAMLMLLGVPDDHVLDEFLLTNTQLLPALRPMLDQFEAGGGDPELLTLVLGARERVPRGFARRNAEQVRDHRGVFHRRARHRRWHSTNAPYGVRRARRLVGPSLAMPFAAIQRSSPEVSTPAAISGALNSRIVSAKAASKRAFRASVSLRGCTVGARRSWAGACPTTCTSRRPTPWPAERYGSAGPKYMVPTGGAHCPSLPLTRATVQAPAP
jgi:protein-tyrosine phosphatase